VGTLGSASNLVISKLHYNPVSATDPEEFVEVMNIGENSVDLTNCHFSVGIEFTFPDGYLLDAGARCVVARNLSAFQGAYPSVPAGQIAGVFENDTALNNGGEPIELRAANNDVIKAFSYDKVAPWPANPDGQGPCLVLINPTSNPDHTFGGNWRASAGAGGTPGASDATGYSAWAGTNGVSDLSGNGDGDNDGLQTLIEYVLGTNPNQLTPPSISTAIQSISVNAVPAEYLTLSFTRVIGNDEATVTVQASSDLTQPWGAAVQVGRPIYNANGTETYTFRHPLPKSGESDQYLRIKATRVP
jgi:hypothetical protein